MSSPLTITLETYGPTMFLAKVEDAGSRYAGLLDETSSSAEAPHDALHGLAEAVRSAERILAERKASAQSEPGA